MPITDRCETCKYSRRFIPARSKEWQWVCHRLAPADPVAATTIDTRNAEESIGKPIRALVHKYNYCGEYKSRPVGAPEILVEGDY
jgi:hypothetical protein